MYGNEYLNDLMICSTYWIPKIIRFISRFFNVCMFAKCLSLLPIRLCDLEPGRRLRPAGLLLLRSHSTSDCCEQGGGYLRVPGRHARGRWLVRAMRTWHRTPMVVRFVDGYRIGRYIELVHGFYRPTNINSGGTTEKMPEELGIASKNHKELGFKHIEISLGWLVERPSI